jgi:prepilin-type N-terminal cleavage/methylation domain-containing protein
MEKIRWFTLVELIVVITILAVLWTLAFISLSRNNADARNTIRITDTKVLSRSIGIHVNAEQVWNLDVFIETPLPVNTFSTGTLFSGASLWSYSYTVWSPNPIKFGTHNFTDPVTKNKYPISIVRWEYGAFYQVGATLESGIAVVHGNYYTINGSDLSWIIKWYQGSWAVVHGQNIALPYALIP